MLETKNELRKYLKQVLSLHKDEFAGKSELICKSILNSQEYKMADYILAYMALPDEVDVSCVLNQALAEGKKVYIPRIIPGTNLMDFYAMEKENRTLKGSFGIMEPDGSSEKFEIKEYEQQILILVPGRGFSKTLDRIGRGKGYYDTFLSKMKKQNKEKVHLAGICYCWQIVDSIPCEAHDFKMDLLFSE